jgi:hypothetical protein
MSSFGVRAAAARDQLTNAVAIDKSDQQQYPAATPWKRRPPLYARSLVKEGIPPRCAATAMTAQRAWLTCRHLGESGADRSAPCAYAYPLIREGR